MAGFLVAEQAVAAHLGSFGAAAGDPALAECFAAQAADEARHARFFARAAHELAGLPPAAVEAAAGPALVTLFGEELPATAAALARGDVRLAAGVGLYHLVLEGIVFAAGQAALLERLEALGSLPALHDGAARVAADERWHVGLGVRCLRDAGLTAAELATVEDAAARAARAWGSELVDEARIAGVLERHRRRVRIALGPQPPSIETSGSASRPASPSSAPPAPITRPAAARSSPRPLTVAATSRPPAR